MNTIARQTILLLAYCTDLIEYQIKIVIISTLYGLVEL